MYFIFPCNSVVLRKLKSMSDYVLSILDDCLKSFSIFIIHLKAKCFVSEYNTLLNHSNLYSIGTWYNIQTLWIIVYV